MSIELKIKSKHLALEPAIIRKEEKKLLKQIRYHKEKQDSQTAHQLFYKYVSLHDHRKINVRNESRATLLARAFIAGIPYRAVEQKRTDERLFEKFIVPRVVAMVTKYGGKDNWKITDHEIKKWSQL